MVSPPARCAQRVCLEKHAGESYSPDGLMSNLGFNARITPFLWFNANAEEAVNFYLNVFKNSRQTGKMVRQVDDPSGRKGTVLTISFELEGLPFTAPRLNAGRGCPSPY